MAQERLQKQFLPSAGIQIGNCKAFSTCFSSHGLQITVGEYVHIVHPTDRQFGLCIARVERLYEDNDGTKYLDARWYYRPEDLRHRPPSCPNKHEVYHTDHIDCTLVDCIAGHCKVIVKADFLRLSSSERSIDSSADTNDSTYFWEFTYSVQKGAFTPVNRRDECQSDSLYSFKVLGGPSIRGTAAVAKELAEVLLDVEATLPVEILPIFWADCRQAWIYKTTNAKTIKEVAQSLLDLEEGVRILNDRRSHSAKDYAAWRKTVSGIHTYDLLAKYVKLFKQDVQHMTNSVCNKATRGMIDHDHGPMKRKHIPETKSKKLQKIDAIRTVSGQSTFRHDDRFGSGQTEAKPVTVESLPGPLSSSKCPESLRTECEILAGGVYIIDKESLPEETPPGLKFMRAVLVAEKTRLHVAVKFPSVASLHSYFGRDPEVTAKDSTVTDSILKSFGQDQVKKETCMGTNPQLDGHFIMTPKLAERAFIRSISGIEYLHQAHLWNFWVEDLENSEGKRFSGGKGSATVEDDVEEDAKGELGAAEALTQLIPANAMIIASSDRNRAENEGSGEYGSEGPFRSQIRWGVRSLRRASFGNRSSNGTSLISMSCDTGTKNLNNKESERTLSRKSVEYSDQRLHQNVGPTRITHDFMQTDRSNRMLSRREEKVMDLGGIKRSSKEKFQLGCSKHNRSNNILKLPKDMKGRWASERYKSAQLKLIDIMHERGAAPGKPILRPVLREEARKDIGDTGLLDHLLKHMTDTVVTNGERFRRRHNAAGAMEYWLEDASFMEMRNAAGIEDPFWIPPPGWKPGDALPGRFGYGYGCFNRGMTPAEAAEMKKLKETVDILRSELHSLTSRVKRSTSRDVTPETEDLQDTVTENHGLIQSSIEFEEEMRDKVSENVQMKVRGVLGDLQNGQDEQNPEQTQNLIGDLQGGTGPESTDNQSTALVQRNVAEKAAPNIARSEEKMDVEIHKLTQEERASCENLSPEKNPIQLQADLSEVQKSVALMQEDVRCIKKALGFSRGEDVKIVSSLNDQVAPPTVNSTEGTLRQEVDNINCSARTSSATRCISLGMFNDSNSSRRKGESSVISSGNEASRVGPPPSGSGHDVRTMKNGFQVYKPPGSPLVWPNSMVLPKIAGTHDSRLRIQDALSPRLPFPAANMPCGLGHTMVTSREGASAQVIYDITGSCDKNQFRPSFPHHVFQQAAESTIDRMSQVTYSDHRQEQNSNRIDWMKAAKRTPLQASGCHQSTYQSDAIKLAGVRRETAQTRCSDGLAILSVVAGCEANDKAIHAGNGTAQDMLEATLQSPLSVTVAKYSVAPSPAYSAAVMAYPRPEAQNCRVLPLDTNHFSMRSIASTGRTSEDSPHSSVSDVAPGQSDRCLPFKPTVSLADRPGLESPLANRMSESSSRGQLQTMFHPVSKATSAVHVNVAQQDPSTNLSLTSHTSPGSTCSSSKSATVYDPEMSSTQIGQLIAAQAAGRSYRHMFSGSPLQKSADQLERLQQVCVNGLEQRQAPKKNFLKGVRSALQASFPEAASEKCSAQSSATKEKGSSWLGLAPPTSSNLHW